RVEAPPAKAYVAISEVARWWSPEHTWSGKAANLSLKAEAGACFCERWADGSVEHGRVVMAKKNAMLRLEASLGPLQEYALNGILTFQLKPIDEEATQLDVGYRVSGSSGSGLDQFAPAVDGVLGAQIDRLLRYVDTGNPEAQADEVVEAADTRDVRAQVIEEWAKQAAAQQAADADAKPAPKKPDATPKP
ncbi:MAG: SRPBCC family protein, partial [Dokdonella sp.]|uniref:SRPBCC family protein n=1 Tax=Dokdonella sp. TaxID=2291710 RepID=UPI003BB03FEA